MIGFELRMARVLVWAVSPILTASTVGSAWSGARSLTLLGEQG